MVATYPAGVMTPLTRGALMSDADRQSTWVDRIQEEVIALQSVLGTNPQGASSTVAGRIVNSRPRLFQGFNAAVVAPGAGAWLEYGVLTFTLDTICDLLITVHANLGSTGGGYCRLLGGINGVMHATSGEGTATHVAGATVWLSHAFKTTLGAGTYNISAFGLTQAGGSMGPGHATVNAVPLSA